MSEAAATDAERSAASRVLVEIAHLLESAEGASERIALVLRLLARVVPYDRCAVLHCRGPTVPELFLEPTPTQAGEREALFLKLSGLFRLMSDLSDIPAGGRAEAAGAPTRAHLALPLVGLDQVVGVLFVERHLPDAYDAESLRILSIVAAQLAAYVTMIRLAQDQTSAHEFQQLLLAIVSHDLRNPLGVIMASAGLLLRRLPDDRLAKALERILTNGQRASRIVGDLLDLTRARLGDGISIDREELDFGPVLDDLVEEFRVGHPDVVLEFERDPELVGCLDSDRLVQVVSNLLANAVRHGATNGAVRLCARAHGRDVQVVVQNQGTPIPAELLASIFDPFKRGERRRGTQQGLGLGLYIVRHIVAAHGGEVTVTSNSRDGTTFAVNLPSLAPPSRS